MASLYAEQARAKEAGESPHRSHDPGPGPRALNRLAFNATVHGLRLRRRRGIGHGDRHDPRACPRDPYRLGRRAGVFFGLRLCRSAIGARRHGDYASGAQCSAADRAAIVLLALVDNAIMLVIPGTMEAG